MSNTTLLLSTIHFASQKHRTQRRKNVDADPYINHPISVANLLSSKVGVIDIAVLQAALLHDTLEDTDTTFEELRDNFGIEVAIIVKEVTDDQSLSKIERKLEQISHSKTISDKAKLVKLADKYDNLSGLFNTIPTTWDVDITLGYFEWSYRVIHGMRGTNETLENLLDILFYSNIEIDGTYYPVLGKTMQDRDNIWKRYEEIMKSKK